MIEIELNNIIKNCNSVSAVSILLNKLLNKLLNNMEVWCEIHCPGKWLFSTDLNGSLEGARY